MSQGNPPPNAPPVPLRFNLYVPGARFSFGPLSFDPLSAAIGRPLEDILRPVLSGPPGDCPLSNGSPARVYPLALPPGMGLAIPLRMLGEVAVHHDAGLLKLVVPAALSSWVSSLTHYRVHGPVPEMSANGVPVAAAWLRMQPGHTVSIPIGALGALVLQAA